MTSSLDLEPIAVDSLMHIFRFKIAYLKVSNILV